MTKRTSNFGGANNSSTPKTANSRNELILVSPALKELISFFDALDGPCFVHALKHVHELALYHTDNLEKDKDTISNLFLVHHLTKNIEKAIEENKQNELLNLLNQ